MFSHILKQRPNNRKYSQMPISKKSTNFYTGSLTRKKSFLVYYGNEYSPDLIMN